MHHSFLPRLVCLLFLTSGGAMAQESGDSVVGMCVEMGRPVEVCECAAESLHGEVGADIYDSYERVGTSYLFKLAEGASRGDAWMAALDAENESLAENNLYGKAHRAAIDACES